MDGPKPESTHQQTGQQQQQQKPQQNKTKQANKIKLDHPTINSGTRTCDFGL